MFVHWFKFLISYLITSDGVLKGFGVVICANPRMDRSVRCEADLIDIENISVFNRFRIHLSRKSEDWSSQVLLVLFVEPYLSYKPFNVR